MTNTYPKHEDTTCGMLASLSSPHKLKKTGRSDKGHSKGLLLILSAPLLALTLPANAQQVGSDDATFADGILVTSGDVSTCPYRLVQPVTISMTEDYGADTRGKIFQKFRDQAIKLGGDAVVLVTKGGRHMTMWAWTRREYVGRVIRYVSRDCAPKE